MQVYDCISRVLRKSGCFLCKANAQDETWGNSGNIAFNQFWDLRYSRALETLGHMAGPLSFTMEINGVHTSKVINRQSPQTRDVSVGLCA